MASKKKVGKKKKNIAPTKKKSTKKKPEFGTKQFDNGITMKIFPPSITYKLEW